MKEQWTTTDAEAINYDLHANAQTKGENDEKQSFEVHVFWLAFHL